MSRVMILVTAAVLGLLAGEAAAQRCTEPERPACERDHRGCCKPGGAAVNAEAGVVKKTTVKKRAKKKKVERGSDWSRCEKKLSCDRYCKASGAQACSDLSDYVEQLDVQAAIRRSACDQGSADACVDLGVQIEYGSASGGSAVDYYTKGCDLGLALGCYYAGLNYHYGTGVEVSPSLAEIYYRKGCEGLSAGACNGLGVLYAKGLLGEADPAMAIKLYLAACNDGNGDSYACNNAAFVYLVGNDAVPKDEAAAVRYWGFSCGAGLMSACTSVGLSYFNGTGVPIDYAVATGYFLASCEKGDLNGCAMVDYGAEKSGADKAVAVAFLDAACTGGNDSACLALARTYAYGGYMSNAVPTRAFTMFEALCGRNVEDGCIELGNAYLNGTGVEVNFELAGYVFERYCGATTFKGCFGLGQSYEKQSRFNDAYTIYLRACEAGDGGSCTMTGFSHYLGRGTTWDVAQAAAYYQRGCDMGNPTGCINLAETNEYGIGVPQDLARARELYEYQCERQDVYSCARLGTFYEDGNGVTADTTRAIELYRKSCPSRFSDTLGCGRLSVLLRATGGDEAEAAELAQRAFREAEKYAVDNPYYRFLLGMFHRDGIGTPRDLAKGGTEMRTGCEAQDAIACLGGAELYLGSHGGAIDFEIAAALAEKACAAKVARGCELSTMARNRTPLTLDRKPHGCGGCGATGSGAAGIWLVVLVLLAARPRRKLV